MSSVVLPTHLHLLTYRGSIFTLQGRTHGKVFCVSTIWSFLSCFLLAFSSIAYVYAAPSAVIPRTSIS
jgi:hypothetical protein